MNYVPKNREISYVEQYLNPLRDFLVDDRVNELVINPNGSIFIEAAGAEYMHEIDVPLSPHAVKRLGAQLAGDTRNTLGALHPIVSGRVMVWGHPLRVQIVVEPAIEYGVSLSIRKYFTHALATKDIGFVNGGQIRVDAQRRLRHRAIANMARDGDLQGLFRQAIEERFNVLVSGGTSSGKTTVARSLISMMDHNERLITIEDAQELCPPHRNQVGLISDRKDKSARMPSKLLESCLRMRPDRIIVGEIRGVEAYDFLEAINTGHPGAITTIHADSPTLAFDRLALMVMRSGIRLTHGEVITYAKRTIDLVVQVGRLNGSRGVLEIYLPSQDEE
ncbi:P-type DNA transfer ATPase VirB11 (plasmid) [Sinorhizobium medicae]|uniref:P-type DNA transfer ATPase VirB11 n=1 Tax=Sinorhizobium medicae TaxID=110321 RepID=UPI002AF6C98B|nr:P-type DNA transfer ATPase VirB11 [Sinorhizobium medicae]WQO48793.1 P-type DNA transfer ATPase VirB11 [Sinorhizobium medicae]WQO69061.1 P-type DNA transfer ATPase VirB11 [Sinorhizobium medicae]WQO75987.1 P-type DNA transfer ATPase VirB11 [Sinorhizobium medicae]WQO95149.1 P-type DNA transfer ATPase VirB11 [Sinorhizobium medicae]